MTEFIEKDKVFEFLDKKAEKPNCTAVVYVILLLIFMLVLLLALFPFFLAEAIVRELFTKKDLQNETIQ